MRGWGPISPNGYQFDGPANDVPFWENEALPSELDVNITAEVKNNATGTPRVEVTKEKEGQEYNFGFDFYNMKGEQGERGEVGATPNVAAAATVDSNVGTPDVDVETTGSLENPTFIFDFKNLKGEQGIKGDTGDPGEQGPKGDTGERGPAGHTPIVSATATVDNTSGTPNVVVTNNGTVEDPSFRFDFTGLKGAQGEVGDTPVVSASATVTSSGSLGVSVTNVGTATEPNFRFDFTGFTKLAPISPAGVVSYTTFNTATATTHSFTVPSGYSEDCTIIPYVTTPGYGVLKKIEVIKQSGYITNVEYEFDNTRNVNSASFNAGYIIMGPTVELPNVSYKLTGSGGTAGSYDPSLGFMTRLTSILPNACGDRTPAVAIKYVGDTNLLPFTYNTTYYPMQISTTSMSITSGTAVQRYGTSSVDLNNLVPVLLFGRE